MIILKTKLNHSFAKVRMLCKTNNSSKGVVLLFAIVLSSILLAVAVGISSIAVKEIAFSTSAKDTNDAFFAADTGAECALYYDKYGMNTFSTGLPTTISCAGKSIAVTFSGGPSDGLYNFIIPSLGSSSQSCAIVTVSKKDNGTIIKTIIDSKGRNIGNDVCVSSSTSLVERDLNVRY